MANLSIIEAAKEDAESGEWIARVHAFLDRTLDPKSAAAMKHFDKLFRSVSDL